MLDGADSTDNSFSPKVRVCSWHRTGGDLYLRLHWRRKIQIQNTLTASSTVKLLVDSNCDTQGLIEVDSAGIQAGVLASSMTVYL